MATVGRDIRSVELTSDELWRDGPPYEVFKQMRHECPIRWTESFELFPEEPGFWSVTTADDVLAVSRDFRTYSSERGGVLAAAGNYEAGAFFRESDGGRAANAGQRTCNQDGR